MEAIAALDGRGYFSRFAFIHLEKDRKRYLEYDEESFYRDFRVDDILFDELIEFLTRYNFKINFYDYEERLKLYIKGAIAEQLFSPDFKARILAPSDAMLETVKKLDTPEISPASPDA